MKSKWIPLNRPGRIGLTIWPHTCNPERFVKVFHATWNQIPFSHRRAMVALLKQRRSSLLADAHPFPTLAVEILPCWSGDDQFPDKPTDVAMAVAKALCSPSKWKKVVAAARRQGDQGVFQFSVASLPMLLRLRWPGLYQRGDRRMANLIAHELAHLFQKTQPEEVDAGWAEVDAVEIVESWGFEDET